MARRHVPEFFRPSLAGLLLVAAGLLALGAADSRLQPGARVIVDKAGSGHRAIVLQAEAARCFVAYEGEDASFDEWVELAAIRVVPPRVMPVAQSAAKPAGTPAAAAPKPSPAEAPVESAGFSETVALPRTPVGAALAVAWLEPLPRTSAAEPLRFNEAKLAQPVFTAPALGGIASERIPSRMVFLPGGNANKPGFAAIEGAGSVAVYRADAAGHLVRAAELDVTVFGAHGLTHLAVGDLNNDGEPDLVALGGPLLQVYFGTADGRFVPAAEAYRSRQPLRGVACGRFFSGINPHGLAVVEGENSFRLLSATREGITGVGEAKPVKFDRILDLVAGDFDGDGYADLAIATETKGRPTGAWMFFNQNSASQSFLWPVGGRDDFARGLAVADLDRDGRDDLILTDNDADRGDRVRVVFGSSGRSGWEDPWDVISGELGVGLGTASVVTGDFNRDGRRDLGVAGRNGLRIYLGADYRRFSRNPVWPAVAGGGGFPEHRAFIAADFNGDGAVDLLGCTPAFATGYNLALNATPENVGGVFVPPPLHPRAATQASGVGTKVEKIDESPPGTPVVRFLASRAEPYGPYRYRIVVEVAATDDGVVQSVDGICKYADEGPLQEITANATRDSEQQWSLEVVLPRGRSYNFTVTAHDDKGTASLPLHVTVQP